MIFATGAEWVRRIEALGFDAQPAGRSILWAEEEAIRQNPAFGELVGAEKAKLGAAMFSQLLPPRTTEDLLPLLAEEKPDLVIYEGADFGAFLAARLSGVPAAFHSYGAPWPDFMMEAMMPNIHALWRSYGLEPPADAMHGDIYLDYLRLASAMPPAWGCRNASPCARLGSPSRSACCPNG